MAENFIYDDINCNNEKKKCKCPELLGKKRQINLDGDLPYHIKKKFTKNILLNEKNNQIILISLNEYNKSNEQQIEEKSSNKLQVVKSKSKLDSKTANTDETDTNTNIKDILNEISEITADLELFRMEKRKRRMMKLIELMADQFDNNLTDSEELSNLFKFGKKEL